MKSSLLMALLLTLGVNVHAEKIEIKYGEIPEQALQVGTGVGNAGDGARAYRRREIKHDLGKYQDLLAWCRHAAGHLERSLRRARMQYSYGDFESSKVIIKDAYVAISESLNVNPYSYSPITKKMVDRGLKYITAIESINQRYSTPSDLHTEVFFLDKYTELILKVENELDRDYFIPYKHSNCRGCGYDFEEFTRKYLKVAYKELNFVYDTFVQKVSTRGHYDYRPVGNQFTFLKLAELSSGDIAADIASTLYRYQNACLVLKLNDLSLDLNEFNEYGDRVLFRTPVQAVRYTASQFDQMLSQFKRAMSGSSHKSRSQLSELLYRRLTLHPGDLKSVPVNDYVQKIYVQAEALRVDAQVEVIVNGDVKRTIYLPARDPNYVVTIADTTSEISFRHITGGKVIISSVKADFGNSKPIYDVCY